MNSITTQLTQLRAPFEKEISAAQTAYDKTVAANKKSVETAGLTLKKATDKLKADYEKLRQDAETEQATAAEKLRLAQESLKEFETQALEILGGGTSTKGHQSNGIAKAGVKTEKTSGIHTGTKAATKAPKKTAAAKAPKKAAAKTAGGAGAKRALQGREDVKANKRPPLVAGIRLILGKKTMRTIDITAELQKRGWEPNSNSLGSYISQIMSANSHGDSPVFEPVKVKGRGNYRVRLGAKPLDPKVRKLFGHVGDDDDKTTVVTKVEAKKSATKAAPAAKAAAPKGKPGQRQCSTCLKAGNAVFGHNAKGHDNWVARQAAASKPAVAKAAPAAKATKSAAPKKTAAAKVAKVAAAPKAKPGKGQQKCGKCADNGLEVFGHNAKGHDKWVASQAAAAAPKAAPAAKAPKAAESKPAAETKSASTETIVTPTTETPKSGFMTADQLLAGGSSSSSETEKAKEAEIHAAFGAGSAPPA